MKNRKFISFLMIGLFCAVSLTGCSPSYPELMVTVVEGEPLSQEHLLVYEIPMELEQKETLQDYIEPALEALVNQNNMVAIPSMSYSKGERLILEFSENPDKLKLDEYWISVDKDTGEYLSVNRFVTNHSDINRDHNPYYTSVDHVAGAIYSSSPPEIVHRGMIATAVFGEKRVQYAFVLVSDMKIPWLSPVGEGL